MSRDIDDIIEMIDRGLSLDSIIEDMIEEDEPSRNRTIPPSQDDVDLILEPATKKPLGTDAPLGTDSAADHDLGIRSRSRSSRDVPELGGGRGGGLPRPEPPTEAPISQLSNEKREAIRHILTVTGDEASKSDRQDSIEWLLSQSPERVSDIESLINKVDYGYPEDADEAFQGLLNIFGLSNDDLQAYHAEEGTLAGGADSQTVSGDTPHEYEDAEFINDRSESYIDIDFSKPPKASRAAQRVDHQMIEELTEFAQDAELEPYTHILVLNHIKSNPREISDLLESHMSQGVTDKQVMYEKVLQDVVASVKVS